jgi:hypothetical protein
MDIEIEATGPLGAYVDGPANRLRLDATLLNGQTFHLWLTAQQLSQSLVLLMIAAQQLGIPWPIPGGEQSPYGAH